MDLHQVDECFDFVRVTTIDEISDLFLNVLLVFLCIVVSQLTPYFYTIWVSQVSCINEIPPVSFVEYRPYKIIQAFNLLILPVGGGCQSYLAVAL